MRNGWTDASAALRIKYSFQTSKYTSEFSEKHSKSKDTRNALKML